MLPARTLSVSIFSVTDRDFLLFSPFFSIFFCNGLFFFFRESIPHPPRHAPPPSPLPSLSPWVSLWGICLSVHLSYWEVLGAKDSVLCCAPPSVFFVCYSASPSRPQLFFLSACLGYARPKEWRAYKERGLWREYRMVDF